MSRSQNALRASILLLSIALVMVAAPLCAQTAPPRPATKPAAKHPAEAAVAIDRAIAEGLLEVTAVEGTGSNYGTRLTVRSRVDRPLRLAIPAGTVFGPAAHRRGNVQRMVVSRLVEAVVDSLRSRTLDLETYCLDAELDPPGPDDYGASGRGASVEAASGDVQAFFEKVQQGLRSISGRILLTGQGSFSYQEGTLTERDLALASCVEWQAVSGKPTPVLAENLPYQVALWTLANGLDRATLDRMAREYEWWVGPTPSDVVTCANAFLTAAGASARFR
ncbi:MAG: hypothetical protein M5U13_13580 [Thermoanaerobaculia bacterium]|nr:hypothetical protein [Thermoanaerobaculia bacterium]